MKKGEKIDNLLQDTIKRYPTLADLEKQIITAFTMIVHAYKEGGKLLCCGNGGSAADCSHIVGELMKSFCIKRPIDKDLKKELEHTPHGQVLCQKLEGALSAISLGECMSLASATANDIGAEYGFAQALLGLGKKGDILLALSTSGNAENCILVATLARALGIKVITLTGLDGGGLAKIADLAIKAPSNITYKVQELHLPIYHTLCAMLEQYFFGTD